MIVDNIHTFSINMIIVTHERILDLLHVAQCSFIYGMIPLIAENIGAGETLGDNVICKMIDDGKKKYMCL